MNQSDSQMDYKEFRQHCLTSRESKAFYPCGSIYELPLKYFLSNPTDSDRMYYVNDICAIPSSRNPPKNFKGTVLIIESKANHPGFVRLKLWNNSYFVRPQKLPEDEVDGPARVMNREYVFPSRLKAALQYFSPLWKDMRAMKTDISYSVYCPYWPPEAQEWLTRKRQHGWPNESLIARVKKGGCHFVSKPHQSNPNDETQWRFSFSKAELILSHSWNPVQQNLYHLLRLAKNKVCKGNSSTALSTYHFKTLMLWACEQKPPDFWNENNITVSLRELLNEMIQTLKDRRSPNYFIPENNMLDHLESDFEKELNDLEKYVKQERYDCIPTIITTIQQAIPGFWLSNTFCEFAFLTIRITLFPLRQELNASLRDKLYKCDCFLPELKQLHSALNANVQLMSIQNVPERAANRDYTVILNGYRAALNASTDESKIMVIFPSSQLDRSLFDMLHQGVVWPVILHRGNNETNFGNQCEFSEFEGDYEIQFLTQKPSNQVTGRSFSIKRIILQKISTYLINKFARESSKQLPSPLYLMSAAYLANIYYTAVSDYDAVLRLLSNEVYQFEAKIRRLFGFYIYFITNLPMIISTDFSTMFDEHVRTVIGFVMLCKTFSRSSTENLQKVVFPLSSIRFLRYIEYQCTLKTNNTIPKVFAYTPDDHEHVNNSARMTVCFSEAFLTAAMRCNGIKVLRVSSTNFDPDFSFGRVLGRVSCRIENDQHIEGNTLLQMLNSPTNASDSEIQLELRGIGFVMAELQVADFILYFHFQSTDDVKLMQRKLRNGTAKTLVQNDFNRLLNRSEVLISVSVKWFPGDYERCVKGFNHN